MIAVRAPFLEAERERREVDTRKVRQTGREKERTVGRERQRLTRERIREAESIEKETSDTEKD